MSIHSREYDDEDDEEEMELTLIKSRSEASSPWGNSIIKSSELKRGHVVDDDDDNDDDEEDDEEDSDDSDAEFAVHPILRSLIKSKSAYTVPLCQPSSMKSSKTTFELNLSKMWASTNESILNQREAPVVNCAAIRLEEKWPEPEDFSMEFKERPAQAFKSSGCWSSPPNFVMDDSNSVASYDSINEDRLSSWSAPEQGHYDNSDFDYEEEDDEEANEVEHGKKKTDQNGEEEEENGAKSCVVQVEETSLYEQNENLDPLQPHLLFSTSYPIIDTPDPISSLCSIRLPSSSGSVPSPSPPRPLSPVLGKPGTRMTTSRSLQLRPRPHLEELLYDNSSASSDEDMDEDDDIDEEEDTCWPQKDPWPQQEVWPEDRVFAHSFRNSWVDNDMPRSVSVQFRPVRRSTPLPNSVSAHSNIQNVFESSSIRQISDQMKKNASSSTSSSTHMLSESERCELDRRSAWLERGSLVQLSSTADCSFNSIRRSCTTDEFKRPRRRLPRRPDDIGGYMPYSMSMYDKCLFEENYEGSQSLRSSIQHLNKDTESVILPSNQMVSKPRPPSTLSIGEPGPAHYTGQTPTSPSYQYTQSSRRQTYQEIATPMSPPKHLLPSPHSTGRRLPALPLDQPYFNRFGAMSVPQAPSVAKNDHTLCFIDGMTDSVLARSTFEDSYYEDDSINGNSSIYRRQRKSFFSPDDSSGVSSCTTSDSINPTHRVQSSFIPRHHDELLLDIGDAVHVERTCEDHWCYGTNLRTSQSGIFPSAVVCEIDLVEEICLGALPTNANKVLNSDRDTFYLTMLASIEVAHHKGNDVLTQAMNKVLALYKNREEVIVPQTVLMEISFRGIHVIDKRKKNFFQCPTFDFFYSLQNISFCGAHPKQLKYFGFITKHPLLPRFACHVFMSNISTQPIVESIGRAFKRSYDEYMAFAHPTEDIYLE